MICIGHNILRTKFPVIFKKNLYCFFNLKLNEDQRLEVVEIYSNSKYEEMIQENLLNFIEENQDSLFMLLHPKDVSKYQN